jgi:hypothetical protein
MIKQLGVCLHCREERQIRNSRGLCFACYDKQEIRSRFPIRSKYGVAGLGAYLLTCKPASHPTQADPGSHGKIVAMMERAKRNECLFHPRDGEEREASL